MKIKVMCPSCNKWFEVVLPSCVDVVTNRGFTIQSVDLKLCSVECPYCRTVVKIEQRDA